MMTTLLLPLFLFTFSTSLTPGPNNFMLMNSGLQFGIKKSFAHYLGICLGFPLMVLAVALGFGLIFIKYVWLKEILKILGSFYMLYLAWQVFNNNKKSSNDPTNKPLNFMQAAIFQWINPKAWIMAIGAISLFSLTTNYFNNALLISLMFSLVCLPCVGAWLVFGAYLKRFLKEERHRRWFNSIMAICLVASIVLIFVD